MIIEILKAIHDLLINLVFVMIVKPVLTIAQIPLDIVKVLRYWGGYIKKIYKERGKEIK